MAPVELATYRIPEPGSRNSNYLSDSYNFRRDITKGGYHDNLRDYRFFPGLAQEVGLREDIEVPTKKGVWHIYEGMDLGIPNFPDGETTVNEALALYEKGEKLTHALLRLEPGHLENPFTPWDLADDLKTFTKYYIERPRLLGFPSETLTRGGTHLLFCLGGVSAGYTLGYMLSGGDQNAALIGADIGIVIPAGPTASLGWISERWARGKIPHKDHYMSGDNANKTLSEQREHIIHTSIQRELYSALQQRGATLTPDQFLKDIYAQMPSNLVNRRRQEIERDRYPERYTDGLPAEALPRMVAVAEVLQQAA